MGRDSEILTAESRIASAELRMTNALDAFLPAVQTWFRRSFDHLTPPQAKGWPAIQRGDHTLILSPTGSGKTLAAFLWGIDGLYREMGAGDGPSEQGVRLLYISPLKALNNLRIEQTRQQVTVGGA